MCYINLRLTYLLTTCTKIGTLFSYSHTDVNDTALVLLCDRAAIDM